MNSLTTKQVEVFELLVQGVPRKEIAEKMGIEATTLQNHFTGAMNRMSAANTYEVIYKATKSGQLNVKEVV